MRIAAAFAILMGLGPSALGAEWTAIPADGVRFEQRLGASLPLSTKLIDLQGTSRPIGDYFARRAIVLYFGYANCPQLCSVVADGTVAALRQIRPAAGRDYDVIEVSIDPTETATAARASLDQAIHRYGDPASVAGWHYLRGSVASIRAVAEAAGFHFVYDPASRQYAHASGFVVLTPQGRISRYFLGVDFEAAAVARAIDRATQGKIGEPVFALLLRCFRGDELSGRYGKTVWRFLAAGVAGTVFGLGGWIGWMLRQERRNTRPSRTASS